MTSNRPWLLADSTLHDVRQADFQVAVLPFGATEPHNTHLPYGTDTLEGETIGREVCRHAHQQGAKVVLLPAIPYGTETNMHRFPLAMNLNPSTLLMVLTDLVESLTRSGIRKMVLLNSHGGNDLKPFLRELCIKTEAKIFLCNWYQMIQDQYTTIFDHPEDHAGEMETSLGLAYFPDLVVRDQQGRLRADDGATRETRFEAVNQGWVSITRPWHLLTTQSGSGYPHAATADKGKRAMDLIVSRLAPFLVELSRADIEEPFPF